MTIAGQVSTGRTGDAGVTLVEMLIVLALVGTLTGAVALSLGSVDRTATAATEVRLLSTRLDRAADEALILTQPVAFLWSERAYRFLTLADGVWVPHPVAILGTPHDLPDGLYFLGDAAAGGRFIVSTDLVPVGEQPLILSIGQAGQSADLNPSLSFDGISAASTPPDIVS